VIESGFGAMLSFYRRTLDVVLRHQAITLGVFFATLALTVATVIYTPKGFFPIQDIGLINGVSEGAQDTSPEEMMRLQRELGEVILRDPDIAGFGSTTGSPNGAHTANTGNFTIVLKPRDQRELNASQIIDRLRPQLAKVTGTNLYLADPAGTGGRVQ
jgi:multidrug efflux pump subunit AcrB